MLQEAYRGATANSCSRPQQLEELSPLPAAPSPPQDFFSPKHSNRYVRVSIEEDVTPDDLLSLGAAAASKVSLRNLPMSAWYVYAALAVFSKQFAACLC